jgi:hypothetical protein
MEVDLGNANHGAIALDEPFDLDGDAASGIFAVRRPTFEAFLIRSSG